MRYRDDENMVIDYFKFLYSQCCGSGFGIRDPVLFWLPGSVVEKNLEPGSGIWDEHPGYYWCGSGSGILSTLDPKIGSGIEDPGYTSPTLFIPQILPCRIRPSGCVSSCQRYIIRGQPEHSQHLPHLGPHHPHPHLPTKARLFTFSATIFWPDLGGAVTVQCPPFQPPSS
jgi:hypothetical protein